MTQVSMNINGRRVTRDISARVHLGDLVRDHEGLTGTHLGCEHGVCGACTVLIDNEPVRSCITFAASCENRDVTTIEGFPSDPVMARLRAAFSRYHALQCGFCTPGMLVVSRDIVLRLPDADENRVRLELSGNICRCTGYMGIVKAVLSVLEDLKATPDPEVQVLRAHHQNAAAALPASSLAEHAAAAPLAQRTGVVSGSSTTQSSPGSRAPQATSFSSRSPQASPTSATLTDEADSKQTDAVEAEVAKAAAAATGAQRGGMQIKGRFEVAHSVEDVWRFMHDLRRVALCLPGAEVTEYDGHKVKGQLVTKFGPMKASFTGAARQERNDDERRATFIGAGQDRLSRSRANAEISYQALPDGDSATAVNVEMWYSLQGPLAQFSRSGLVQDFVGRMIQEFGKNINLQLDDASGRTEAPRQAAALNPTSMMLSVLWTRIKRVFSSDRKV